MSRSSLAKEVSSLRQSRSWSQAHLAEAAGVSLRTIQRLEDSGRCAHETLLSVAAALEVDVQLLTGRSMAVDSGAGDDAPRTLSSFSALSSFLEEAFMASAFERIPASRLACVGVLCLAAPCYFIVASLLKYGFGILTLFSPLDYFLDDPLRLRVFNAVTPILFLGGAFAACVLNLYPLLRIEVRRAAAGETFVHALRSKLPTSSLPAVGS